MAKKILIVDDDVDVREAMETILTGAGYNVVQAADGKEAEKKLAAGKIDLVLLDVMMETDTRGFHVAYKMRQDPKLKDIPIIMLTGIEAKTGETIDPEKSGDYLPVQVYLRKPADPAELRAKVKELIG